MSRVDTSNLKRELTPQERLDAAIQALGTNPAQVAARMGMTRQNIYAIQAGRPVTPAFANNFQSWTGISATWLLTGEGGMWFGSGQSALTELPLLDEVAFTSPKRTPSWSGEVYKLAPHLCIPSASHAFRYVLRVNQDDLAPTILRDDRLLMEARFDLNLSNAEHRQLVDQQLCGMIHRGRICLAWIGFAANDIRRPWPVMKSMNRTARASLRKEFGFQVAGICKGMVWRQVRQLSMPTSDVKNEWGDKVAALPNSIL